MLNSKGDPRPIVLIADDDPISADGIASIVQAAGYAAMVAHHGLVALALARRYRPSLLITEQVLPGMDAADLVAGLRERDDPALPVIVLTDSDRAERYLPTANGIMQKPFHPVSLRALLAVLLPLDRPDYEAAPT